MQEAKGWALAADLRDELCSWCLPGAAEGWEHKMCYGVLCAPYHTCAAHGESAQGVHGELGTSSENCFLECPVLLMWLLLS